MFLTPAKRLLLSIRIRIYRDLIRTLYQSLRLGDVIDWLLRDVAHEVGKPGLRVFCSVDCFFDPSPHHSYIIYAKVFAYHKHLDVNGRWVPAGAHLVFISVYSIFIDIEFQSCQLIL